MDTLVPDEWDEPPANVCYHLGRPPSHRLGRPLALQTLISCRLEASGPDSA